VQTRSVSERASGPIALATAAVASGALTVCQSFSAMSDQKTGKLDTSIVLTFALGIAVTVAAIVAYAKDVCRKDIHYDRAKEYVDRLMNEMGEQPMGNARSEGKLPPEEKRL
jgi:hypothetical protein